MRTPEIIRRRGWELMRLTSDEVSVDVVPGKGADILSVRRRRDDLELLWQSPWGLRQCGALSGGGDSVSRLMEAYPGGWQTVFPNGGDAVCEHGVEWGMHGEAWLTPFDTRVDGPSSLTFTARLVRSPFTIEKHVVLAGPRLTVTEHITNVGGHDVEAMWIHHPAFGSPLLSPDSVLEVSGGTVVVDDRRDLPSSDLGLGMQASWPHVPARDGSSLDLRRVPAADAGVDRMAYVTGVTDGRASLRNPRLDVGVVLEWDTATMPHAWYWLEAAGTAGFPWYQSAYVLAIEPASSWPAQGIAAVRAKGGAPLVFAPGQTRTATTSLLVTDGEGHA